MTSSQAPKPPTVGQEFGSSLQALQGGGAGTLETIEGTTGSNLAKLNTGINLKNISTLTNSLFGSNGFEQGAQNQAISLGNNYLSNQMGLVNQNLGTLTGELNNANPYASKLESTSLGSSFIGAGLDSNLTNLSNLQANAGTSINPTLSDISKTGGNILGLANSQLSLGSALSPEMTEQIAQASSSADSTRGIFNSNTSAFNQSLAEGTFGQQLLQQREQFATGAQQGVANATATGLGAQIGAFSASGQTQNAALQQQFQRQNAGLNQLNALTSIGANNAGAAMNTILGQSQAGAGVGNNLWGSGLNILSSNPANQGAPLFNSLGLFSAAQDNAITAYNGSFAAQEQNAQASNSLLGAGIGSGIGLLGSVGSSTGLFSSIGSGISAGLGALFSY